MKHLLSSVAFSALALMVIAYADDPNAPGDFTITSNVVAPAPERYGTNLGVLGFPDYNNMTADPGFEPFVLRKMATATGGGADYILNDANATTTHYDILGDGFFDGAGVRVYRTVNGRMTLLRTGTVSQYIGGWNRVLSNRLTATAFKDGGLTAGKTYYYAVRAYDTSGNLSGNSNVVSVTALASAGVGDTITATFAPTVTDHTAPAAPTGLSAVTNADGTVSLSWNASGESDFAGYYVYRGTTDPALHNRIYITGSGPSVAAGDYYFLDWNPDNVPMEKLSPRVASYFGGNDTWREVGGAFYPFNQPVTKMRDSSTVCPENGGRTSMKLTASGAYEVSLRQFRYSAPDGYYGSLVPGKTYRVDVWMKQQGIASGAATFKMTGAYAAVAHTWTGVSALWQKFTFDFTAPAYPSANAGTVEQMIAFNGPGTLWIDNLLVYDPTQPLLAFRPEAKQQMADFAPGWIRVRCGHTDSTWGTTMEDWTNTDALAMNQFAVGGGRARPENAYHLPFQLQLCKDTGANPWLIVGSFMSEQEWLDLIEYLAGPAGTPYGDKRIAQRGITNPWTDDFTRIRIEFGNEMWNPTFEWNLNGADYGRFMEYFFHVAHSSPWFPALANKVDFISNGQLVSSGTGGFLGSAAQVPPANGATSNYANAGDLALYLGGWDANVIIGNGQVNDTGFNQFLSFAPTYGRYWFDLQAQTRDSLAALGRNIRLCNYESAPGYALPGPGSLFDPISEAYGKSLAAGVSTLDSFLYGTYRKIDPQCYFLMLTGTNWASHGYVVNGNYPYPSWQVLQMRNRYASGDMVATAANTTPTVSVPAWLNSTNNAQLAPAQPNMPLVATYAFRDGVKWSVFVLSRKLTNSTSVTLRLPFDSIGSGMLYKLTGDPRARNDQGVFNIQETQEAVTNFARNYTFSMPPSSAYLFVFDGTNTIPETNPSCTVSRAVGQGDPTTSQGISFNVHFSQPVTGFTASDVLIGGTAGATVAGVTEVDPFLGTDFRVDVSGMTGSGTVAISVPANAAFNSSSQGNLASLSLGGTVQFNMPPFTAYDDFSIAPSSAPNPPFLNAVGTGSGFSSAWTVPGFSAATYGDGYKLANTTPLAFSNLRRNGSYVSGGKDFGVAWRALDVDGTFGFYKIAGSTPSVIGRSGTTLWVSALMRKDTGDNGRLLLYTGNNAANLNVGGSNLGFGFCGDFASTTVVGGTRYWSLQVRNSANNNFDCVRTNVPVVTGQAALLVLKCSFGTTDRFDLYVNPSSLGGAEPASPNATWTTTGATDINFHTLGYSGGTSGANQSSIDEIRFGRTFADVTPTFTPAEMWRVSKFGIPDATGNAAHDADPDGDGLPNFLEYALGSEPMSASPGSVPSTAFTQISAERYLTLETVKNAAATDVTYSVEVSDDLITWHSGSSNTTVVTETATLLRVRDNVPVSAVGRRFIRLRVSSP